LPGVVTHAYHPSTQEAEAEGSGVSGQPGLHGKTTSQKPKDQTIFLFSSTELKDHLLIICPNFQ
jgi:hypothetical protein